MHLATTGAVEIVAMTLGRFSSWCQACLLTALLLGPSGATARELDRDAAARLVEPPYQLGEPIGSGRWELVNLDGRLAGYAFESAPLAPLPGFSGAPINLFVSITLEGKFIDVEIVSHNEPIFVSGLGETPFNEFVAQYRGHSITDTLVVGVPYGDRGTGSSLVYLDGVTKATASVRIAHESILAAAFAVARDRIKGVARRASVRPDPDHSETLTWADLVSAGLATRRLVTNRDADAAFTGTLWEDDDPVAKADPDAAFLDLWLVDIGPPAIARAALADETLTALARFREISSHDEPLLVIDAGRHGLVGKEFVRNTSPDLIVASQDGLPVALRDADLDIDLLAGVPDGAAMILRTDRRLGFDPSREWTLSVRAVREHGFFRPEIGVVDFSLSHKTDDRFFQRVKVTEPVAPWRQAVQQRIGDLMILAAGLGVLLWLLSVRLSWLAARPHFVTIRLAVLALVVGFVGWWGQGQLSIVTVLGVLRGVVEGQSLAFLLYDPFSLLIWGVVLVSFVAWGRGLFCGWLCPFGALQELTHAIGRRLGAKPLSVPDQWDGWLLKVKYLVLAFLMVAALSSPAAMDTAVEVEPFKTAITVYFLREWYYVAYAAFWLLLAVFVFKGFCRYVCPLGAVMVIGGLARRWDWIKRRAECGGPCQLCRVRCNYNAIAESGKIRYDECFQCLDCVTIHDDPKQCVPLVLAARQEAQQS